MNRYGHFDALARALHWLMAAMILAMLFIGAGMVVSLAWRPTLLMLVNGLVCAWLLWNPNQYLLDSVWLLWLLALVAMRVIQVAAFDSAMPSRRFSAVLPPSFYT